jgi:hypothetical protein
MHIEEYEIIDSVNASHMDMCRFTEFEDDGYIKVRDAISYHICRLKKSQSQSQEESVTASGLPPKRFNVSNEGSQASVRHQAVAGTESNLDFDAGIYKEVSRSLYFEENGVRKYQVYEDTSEAFSWVWSDMTSSTSFSKWLVEGSGPYWITGLPGKFLVPAFDTSFRQSYLTSQGSG